MITRAVNDGFELRYYGNNRETEDGTYVTGWVTARGDSQGSARRHYYKQGPPADQAHRRFTTDEMGDVVGKDRLVCWGFRLSHNDRLPRAVRSLLHADDRVTWTLPVAELEEES